MSGNITFCKDEIRIGDYRIELGGHCENATYNVYKKKKYLVSPDGLDKAVDFCINKKTKCEHINKTDPNESVTKKSYCWDCGHFLDNGK